jgi:thiamine biosynthesis protein ThiI
MRRGQAGCLVLRTYVVHYSEIALKGKNRPFFTKVLRRNLHRALRSLGDAAIDHVDGRFIVSLDADEHEAEARISKVFGVSWFALTTVVEGKIAPIREAVLRDSVSIGAGRTFKIAARRADKTFPMGSMLLAKELGASVAERTGAAVDLKEPDVTLHVDVLRGRSLVYSSRLEGPGGLPVGVGGRVVHLFSGGIDSPVAAWLLMKRGCRPVHLHFFLAPSYEYVLQSKILKIVNTLSDYCGRSTLVMVPFAHYQVATADVPAECEPSLFRRFMRLTAETLAPQFGAAAISTGDSLAQAASQTLWNLGTFDDGCPLPVLRPLLTYDKQEITDIAQRIGTYEASIEDYKDCCAIITRHPKTRARRETIAEYAAALDFPSLVRRCLADSTLAIYDPTRRETKTEPLLEALESGNRSRSEGSRPAQGEGQEY